jgi:hypothetical protein
VDARARQRLEVARMALRLLRHRDFRNEVADTNAHGEHVIVPALPDDTMGELFGQLHAAKGTIYVAVPDGDELAIITMTPTRPARHAAASDDCPIYRHMEVKMVLDYLRMCRTPVRCYEALPDVPNVMMQLLNDGPALPDFSLV